MYLVFFPSTFCANQFLSSVTCSKSKNFAIRGPRPPHPYRPFSEHGHLCHDNIIIVIVMITLCWIIVKIFKDITFLFSSLQQLELSNAMVTAFEFESLVLVMVLSMAMV